jgi:molybdenum cofactor guanylyltransferase
MGRDKALIRIDGVPMVVRVADALRAAGATDVLAVGREPAALSELGLATVPDDRPGDGPVAGITAALAHAAEEIVLVAGCDLLAPTAAAMATTVAELAAAPAASVAVPRSDGRRQWAHAAWRRSAGPTLTAALEAGERAVGHAVAIGRLIAVDVEGIDPSFLADADTPDDLPRG